MNHIVAQPIQIEDRIIQRCAICGVRVLDFTLNNKALTPAQITQIMDKLTFDLGVILRETGGKFMQVGNTETMKSFNMGDCCITRVGPCIRQVR